MLIVYVDVPPVSELKGGGGGLDEGRAGGGRVHPALKIAESGAVLTGESAKMDICVTVFASDAAEVCEDAISWIVLR